MKQWRLVLEVYLFANDMSNFFDELDNSFPILKKKYFLSLKNQ